MNLKKEVVILVMVCVAIFAPLMVIIAEEGATEGPGSISKQVAKVFEKLDRLDQNKLDAIRRSLVGLSDEELVCEYARPIESSMSQYQIDKLRKRALDKVNKDRKVLVEELAQARFHFYGTQDQRIQDMEQFHELVGELAELGIPAVPAISRWMSESHDKMRRSKLAMQALMGMGPDAVEPLIRIMDMDTSMDSTLKGKIICVLRKKADSRAKTVFLDALHDKKGHIRLQALLGLVRLGPDVVGRQAFVQIMLNALDDDYPAVFSRAIQELIKLGSASVGHKKLTRILTDSLQVCPLIESIRALGSFGDEKAIEPLRAIKCFHPDLTGKMAVYHFRYEAHLAINAILERAGETVEPVSREHYKFDFSNHHAELLAAAQCPNPAIRERAVWHMEYYGYSQEAVESMPDTESKPIGKIFSQLDELDIERKQRSREYVNSLTDEELAKVWGRDATQMGLPFKVALKAVKKDRQKIIEQFLKFGSPLNEQDARSFNLRYSKLVERLAVLGPDAVPALSVRLGEKYRRTGNMILAKKALLKIGPVAIESLLPLMDSQDRYLRENVTDVLADISDPRAENALLQAFSDEYGPVRREAVKGLVRLGPRVVGKEKLNTILIEGLQDSICLYDCVKGLRQYGTELAIEPLRVIERFHLGRGKGNVRYSAAVAICAILQRSGKPTQEVSREHYSDEKPSYDELIHTAIRCPNIAIRLGAISLLEQYREDRTALFFIQRLHKEQDRKVLFRLVYALGILTFQAGDNSKSVVSPPVVQEVFDTLLLMAEMDPPRFYGQEGCAVGAARTVLHAARRRKISLDHIDRYKKVIRQGLSANIEYRKTDYYSGCTAIAMLLPETGNNWSRTEKEQIQQQLSPLLDFPNPNIRLIECLGYIGDKRLTLRLIELLKHNDASTREFAAHALRRIGDSRALQALDLLAETDPYQYANGVYGVRKAAREAIERIRKVEPVGLTNSSENHKVD